MGAVVSAPGWTGACVSPESELHAIMTAMPGVLCERVYQTRSSLSLKRSPLHVDCQA